MPNLRTVADVYTLPDLLARAVNRDPDGWALMFPNTKISFADLYERCPVVIRDRHRCWRPCRHPDVQLSRIC